MDQKTIISNVIVAVVTAAIMAVLGWAAGVFERGQAAIDEDRIREVIREELVTDAGVPYGKALTDISLDVNTLTTQFDELSGDVEDLTDAVWELARE